MTPLCDTMALFIAWYRISGGRDGQHQLQGYRTCVGGTLLWIVHAHRDVFSRTRQGHLRLLATLMLRTGSTHRRRQKG